MAKQFTITHLLDEKQKQSVFTDELEFIRFAQLIRDENEDDIPIESATMAMAYIRTFCSNLDLQIEY